MTPSRRAAADDLTLRQAAEILGVHYTTAYRYVRSGRLAATQIGIEWRVPRSSIDSVAEPVAPGRARSGATISLSHYQRRLAGRLVDSDEREAWRVTQQALASACTPEDLYLDVLGPAMHQIGDEWAAGRLSVADEHRASTVMARLIGRLGPLHTRRGRTRGLIILGAPANDFHGLATAFVADVLRGRGFAVADLGANTPSESFVETISGAGRLLAVGVAASARFRDAHVAATVDAIRAVTDVPLLLGGIAIRNSAHARRLGADASTTTARDAVDWFDATTLGLSRASRHR
jgi:excisionase family DNA binding protein